MISFTSFDQAISEAKEKRPHLLLGNGFSQALFNDIFSYRALLETADFKGVSRRARKAFEKLKTSDFEVVIRGLQNAANLGDLYKFTKKPLKMMRSDAEQLKEVLVAAIAKNHPDLPNKITDDQYHSCRVFISNFERIFSTNYDLLLYWTIMQSQIEPPIKYDDGFRTPEVGPQEYVSYKPKGDFSQTVYYLHGALHLFDTDAELQKYTWINTGVPLITQIRTALDEHKFPLFVAEGTSEQKVARIRHSDYLSHCIKSFSRIGRVLFTYGFSFSDNDSHIYNLIKNNDVTDLYVSVYGDPKGEANQRIISTVAKLAEERTKKIALNVHFYKAESANVWL